jgi:hypothetical protein
LAFFAVLACSSTLAAQTLMWNANPEPDLAGYIVQYGTTSGSPSTSLDVGRVTSRTFTGLQAGTTYYFRVVAYNTARQNSVPSTQVSYTVPATPSTTPAITSFTPTSGPTTGGTVITITGANFATGATVRIGGVAATGVTRVSSTQLRATSPAGTAGARSVLVTNSNGQSATAAAQFTYTAPSGGPTITSVSPSSGPTAGGTTITITGAGYVVGTGGEIRVGGVLATGVTYVSSTQLRAVTPPGTAGAQAVSVRNPNGATVSFAGGFTYTAPALTPTLTSVTPSSGPTAGGTVVTLTGTNFVSGATVRVGGAAATGVTFVSATQVRATTPAGTAGARDVQITNPGGQSATRTGAFTYTSSTTVTITSVSPASGPTSGGTVITITGANYVLGSGGEIRVGGVMCSNIQYISSTQLRATTPSGTAGARDVFIRNPNGQTVTRTGGFTYTTTSSLTRMQSSDIQPLSAATDAPAAANTMDATMAEAAAAVESTIEAGAPAADTTAGGVFRRYLAEGIETDHMNTRLALANPGAADAHVRLTFQQPDGAARQLAVDVPARARRTVAIAEEVPELAGASFSTRLESDQPVALDRLISWDARGVGASLEAAADQPSARWYFAEGATADPFELFYLVQNPGTTPARVQVRYLLPDGAAPITRSYTVGAGSRATIWVDREDAALAATDVAAEITSLDGSPIVVERSLYLSEAGSTQPRGGDTSAGVTAPATSWFIDGATGAYAMRLLIANPGATPARVQATYQVADATRVARSYTVAPSSRLTIDVAREHAALGNAEFGVALKASAPVVVERTKWWGANGTLDEAVSGSGITAGAARWLLAEGEMGGAREATTSLVVFNRGAATDVTVTLLFEDGPETSATFAVAAGGRFAVPMDRAFPVAEGRRFSVLVEGADAAASLAVERELYWHAEGGRTAGADGAATRLP